MGPAAPDLLGPGLLDHLAAEPSHGALFSPCSLAFCLALALNGAGGRTRDELARALGVEHLAEPEVNRFFRDLRTRAEQPGPQLEVDLASAVWGLPGTTFDARFQARAREFYAAEVRSLAEAGAAGAEVVNGWVSRRTRGRIPRVLKPDDLVAGASCVLTGAVYFKGPWATPFEPRHTRTGSFRLPDGRRTDVAMMNRSGVWDYLEDDEFQALALDYAGGVVSMHVVLPRAGRAPDLRRWRTALPRYRPTPVDLSLPRFSVTSEVDLVPPLHALGIRAAFEPGADFGRMGLSGSFISALPHTARIDVSEEGTEAAASSAVVMGRSMPVEMVVDRPFLLAVVDRRSELPLFLGWITEPQPVPSDPGTA
jgi:serpin B